MRKLLKSAFTTFTALMVTILSCATVFAADNHFYIEELKMNVDIPEEVIAITRESPETDRYFSVFGLDYNTTMQQFQSANIYLQGMYSDSSRILTITADSDEDSKSVDNYNKLSDDQLLEVQESFLAREEYTSCTIQRFSDYVYMDLQVKTQTNGQTVYAAQCNTVVDGNSVTITLQPSGSQQLTADDYQILGEIISSVNFDGKAGAGIIGFIQEPVFLICVIAVLLIAAVIIIVVLIVKRRKKRVHVWDNEKQVKNDEILRQLAREYSASGEMQEYSRDEEFGDYAEEPGYFSDGEETAEDILRELRQKNKREETAAAKQNRSSKTSGGIYAEPSADSEYTDIEALAGSNAADTPADDGSVTEQQTEYAAVERHGAQTLNVVLPEQQYEQEKQPTDGYSAPEEADVPAENGAGRVFASEESFDQGEDYFDEVPKETANDDIAARGEEQSVPARARIHDAERAKAKAKTAGAVVLNGILIFLNGVKSFFIHLGYFITNVVRLIKRKDKMRKRKKAEMEKRRRQEEARRRRQENMMRKRQKSRELEANGLMKVHSQRKPYPRTSSGRQSAGRRSAGRR